MFRSTEENLFKNKPQIPHVLWASIVIAFHITIHIFIISSIFLLEYWITHQKEVHQWAFITVKWATDIMMHPDERKKGKWMDREGDRD